VLSQCPMRIIFKMVDPSDCSWLRESGLSADQINRVKKLRQGRALVIGMGPSPTFIKVRQRACTHGGSTPIAKAPLETPELSEAVKDLVGFIKASPTLETETPRGMEVSIKQLKERTHHLLEKATKALERACTQAEGGKGEHDLNSGMLALGVEGGVQDRLKAVLKENGISFADWVKQQLEIKEAEETTYKKAYDEGRNDGYDEAKKKYLVTFPCSLCGKTIEITHPKTKEAVAKYMREYGWGHVACHELRKKG